MSINYRKVDPNAVGQKVMKDRALDLEAQAYSMETEAGCLSWLAERDPTDEDLFFQLATARIQVEKLRRAASRAAGASPLIPEEIQDIHAQVLETWQTNVERIHAERTALFNEAARWLGLKGSDALTDEERLETEAAREQLQVEIDKLELRHEFCISLPVSNTEDTEAEADVLELVPESRSK